MANILITGVTDGIGKVLANLYTSKGDRVIGVGRRPLTATTETDAGDYCQVNLCEPDSSQNVVDFLSRRQITQIDVLIHNAAMGWYGPFAEQDPSSIRDLLEANFYAPIALTHALMPYLGESRGCVVFVSSVHSVLATPDFAVYTATKAALDGFARNLRIENRGKLDVLCVWPGATQTGMHAKSGMPADKFTALKQGKPEHVAGEIVSTIERRRSTTIGAANWLLRWAAPRLEGLLDNALIAAARRRTI